MRGKVLGHPLTTYDPRLPLIGDRVMLLGDAAGLINPLNGEGIQYALHSARWAADIAAARLDSDRLDAASLEGYRSACSGACARTWRCPGSSSSSSATAT